MSETRYRVCANRTLRLAQQPCWFVEKTYGHTILDTTPYCKSKWWAIKAAFSRWPELASIHDLFSGRAA